MEELSMTTGAVAASATGCVFCGSNGREVVFRPGEAQVHGIVRCGSCGLMYAYPLEERNEAHYVGPADTPLDETDLSLRHALDKAPDYAGIPKRLRRLGVRGRLLDVGCYVGAFLRIARDQGWEARGAELDGRAVAYARERFGLQVYHAPIERLAQSEQERGHFDAVTMLHVIEHVDDPRHFVEAARDLLRPGGMLVVETPTYDSLMFRLLGRRERSVSCDGHIFFFTPQTLGALIERAGLEVVRTEKVGRTVSVGRLLWNVGVMTKNPAIQRGLESLSQRRKLYDEGVRLHLNVRDMVRMYARRLR
jgi:SAM-dependent methyltransferase